MYDFLTIYLYDTALFEHLRKSMLIFGTAFVCNYRGQTFPVVFHQGFWLTPPHRPSLDQTGF